jgi:hypothetical protein
MINMRKTDWFMISNWIIQMKKKLILLMCIWVKMKSSLEKGILSHNKEKGNLSLKPNHGTRDLQFDVLSVVQWMRWKYGKNIGGKCCLCVCVCIPLYLQPWLWLWLDGKIRPKFSKKHSSKWQRWFFSGNVKRTHLFCFCVLMTRR